MSEQPIMPDELLAERCQSGDLEAFELLFGRYQRPILAYLFQIVRNYEEAACISQDVFLKVFEHVGRFDSNRRFSTWFYAIARNAAIDFLHSRRRKVMISFSDLDREEGDDTMTQIAAGNLPRAEVLLQQAEAGDILRLALADLPQVYREIIELVVFQDLSYEQASAILGGISLGTLRSRMFHALRVLRRRLEIIGGGDGADLV